MPSVLFIGAGAPWAGGAGYLVRQRMFLRALAEQADLTLALFEYPPCQTAETPHYANRLYPLPAVERPEKNRFSALLGDLFSSRPRLVMRAEARAAQQAVRQLHPEKFDAVFAFRIDFAHFAGVLGHPRLLLDVDDPEHLRRQRQLQATTRQGGDRRTRHDLHKLAIFEKSAVRSAAAAFVCQENDATLFNPTPIVVPNCVDVPERCPTRQANRPRVLFLGNVTQESPNADGLIWFIEKIWPLILEKSPAAEFHVVGKVLGEPLRQVENTRGARAVGFVEDLPAAMAQASLSIAPIRFGTGTRVKIIESFALGCPVVSTTLGYDGIDVEPEKHLLAGDTPEQFARQCVRLLNDPALQASLANAAFAVAAARYSEQGRRPQLVQTLSELLARCTAGAAR